MTVVCRHSACGCVLALALLGWACGSPLSPDASGAAALRVAEEAASADGVVTVPFAARFLTDLAGLAPDESCGAPPRLLNVQEGYGEATHLGRFTVRITFCFDPSELLDDGVLSPGESLPYDQGMGTLVAANGDVLFVTIAGAVLPSDHPDYDFEFSDPFEIVGGTGRFEGASGAGTTNSLVDFQSQPSRTDHVWTGTLSIPRGR